MFLYQIQNLYFPSENAESLLFPTEREKEKPDYHQENKVVKIRNDV